MELDAFTSRLGDGQGRVATPEGDVQFVLGEIDAGRSFELAVGDYVEASQTTDLTGVALVRVLARLRVPASLPATLAWEVSVVVEGEKRASARCASGRTRAISDLAANVSKLSGAHTVGVRLSLVEV